MDRGEPTLAPEWLKAAGSSSHSDEHNSGTSSRVRLLTSLDHDAPRASSSSSSAFRRSVSSSGSIGHDKDNNGQLRAYSSFGRSHRDRDRDRERDRDRNRDRQRDREKDGFVDNGYGESSESIMTRRIVDKDTLRRTHSMVLGRRIESMPKRIGIDSGNGGLKKVSFERDFPSLGAEEKHGVSEVGRVSFPSFSTAINSPHISSSSIIADGWTSALAEVPSVGGINGPSTPTSCTNSGLSMAEALAQAPIRARTAPPLLNESERRKELALMQQYNKLIPMTPSGPKNSVLNSSDKSKSKGARNGDLVAPKISQQSSSQLVNQANRLSITRHDFLKSSQAGNLLVLNREKNGTSLTSITPKDKSATSFGIIPSASNSHMKTHVNPKLKGNGIVGEKKPLLSQDKINFFNSLRKQAELKNGVQCASSSLCSSSITKSKPDNYVNDTCDDDDEMVAPNEEEKAFMESLGWPENTGESALTDEEIASFFEKHNSKLRLNFKYKAGLPESWRSGRCLSALSLSNSDMEM